MKCKKCGSPISAVSDKLRDGLCPKCFETLVQENREKAKVS